MTTLLAAFTLGLLAAAAPQPSTAQIRACAGLDLDDKALADDLAAQVKALHAERAQLELERASLQQAMHDLIDLAEAMDPAFAADANPTDAPGKASAALSQPAVIVMAPEQPVSAGATHLPREPAKLVKIAESMKADAAASVLGRLDDELLRQVVRAMKPKKAAKLLAAFDPARAARLAEAVTHPDQGVAP